VTYNAEADLKILFKRDSADISPCRIYNVDVASKDGTLSIIRIYRKNITCVVSEPD
jgi:hypothetical protein